LIGVGLDLGAAGDFTALAAVERVRAEASPLARHPWRYAVRGLERYELGTTYPEIVTRVKDRLAAPPLAGCRLVVDYTGVGRPVVDMLRAARIAASVVPVLITSGTRATYHDDDRSWRVPKADLVNTLQVLLQASLIRWSPGLALAETLAKELTEYQTRITAAGNEQFGAWREGQHDDLVLAVALACWALERQARTTDPHPYGESVPAAADAAPPGVFRDLAPEGVFRGAASPQAAPDGVFRH